MKEIRAKIPNVLTIGRVLIIPLIVILLYMEGEATRIAAASLFLIAGFTDMFDGYLARHWNVQSLLGRMLDPIADKVLIVTALVMLIETRLLSGIHVVPALLIIGRDMLMSALRELAAQHNQRLEVTTIAKVKTVVQLAAVNYVMTSGTVFDHLHFGRLGLFLLWVAAALAVYTMFDYIIATVRGVSTAQSTHHL